MKSHESDQDISERDLKELGPRSKDTALRSNMPVSTRAGLDGSREGILWIGGLEPYMSEQFIRNALSLMGEDDALTKVKLIRNKYTGERASYGFLQVYSLAQQCFIHFLDN